MGWYNLNMRLILDSHLAPIEDRDYAPNARLIFLTPRT
jgi:hypothetical protein